MATLSLLFQLERTEWWPADRLRDGQQAQLKRLLDHATRHVPFYRHRLSELADADGEAFWQGWRELPLLTRQDVQRAGDDLLSHALPDGHGELTEVYTSGSTGKPIHAVRSDLWLLMWSAVTVREHLWHGRDFSGKLAAIRESTPGKAPHPDGERLENWGFSTADIFRTGPCVSLNITTPVDDQLEWLCREEPDYLLTHPTMLDRLIRRSAETGLRPKRLRQVLTISEILAPGLRQLCRAEWGAPVVDTYSTREAGYLALQCPDTDHYHLQSETALVEILDPAGKPCAPGEIGRVIVTPLHNLAMPLLRYDVGDHAEVGAPCPCGRDLPVIRRILGRRQNMLRTAGGERWPLLSSDDIGKLLALAPIRQYQFAQTHPDRIEVRLQAARTLTDGEVRGIVDWAQAKFGQGFRIDLAFPAELLRTASGKFEDFVCLL
ncbi:MAG: AMP-binding protein [Rhodospirillales bacterium]|nr:AMP-binding protein [Rhodospirillales bacterium]